MLFNKGARLSICIVALLFGSTANEPAIADEAQLTAATQQLIQQLGRNGGFSGRSFNYPNATLASLATTLPMFPPIPSARYVQFGASAVLSFGYESGGALFFPADVDDGIDHQGHRSAALFVSSGNSVTQYPFQKRYGTIFFTVTEPTFAVIKAIPQDDQGDPDYYLVSNGRLSSTSRPNGGFFDNKFPTSHQGYQCLAKWSMATGTVSLRITNLQSGAVRTLDQTKLLRATAGAASDPAAHISCHSLGNEIIVWAGVGAGGDNGVTFRLDGDDLKPISGGFPVLSSEHYVIFADQRRYRVRRSPYTFRIYHYPT